MIVLGIETSCDETAVALVTDTREILANHVLSQTEHAAFGGVVPEVAARAHLNHIDSMIEKTMTEAKISFDDLSAIAVTAGPGLIGGVMVGAMTAKAIAAVKKIPLVAVNHLEGHALTVRLTNDISFPYLLLLVSGGHCQILVVEGVGKYKRLGATLDDAAGECFDKTAKLLGLGYPGGPAVEKCAATCANPSAALKQFTLPRPLLHQKNCDFSFSGLKTAVRRLAENIKEDEKPALCFVFQETVGEILCNRIQNAIERADCKTLVVAGGVAANRVLREKLEKTAAKNGMAFAAPPLKLCTDNAAMIAWAGIERLKEDLTDPLDFPVYPRWPLDKTTGTGKK